MAAHSVRLVIASAFSLAATAAYGQEASGVKFSALLDAGITVTDSSPDSGVNFGHLLTDKHDQVLLNQFMLTAQKDLDPKAAGYDWGFKAQGFYGSDARYTHFLGVFDRNPDSRNQFDITEANLLGHLPLLTEGGIDVKAGLYTTPMGSEVIPASGNTFYSHSYIFNFGLPYKHAGVLTTTHANPMVDVYLGVDTGVNTTFGNRGDNNDRLAGLAGLGLNLMDGQLTILGLSHFGAENPSRGPNGSPAANHQGRYINDISAIYKATDKLTLTTELNYIKDDLAEAQGYGIAQYGVYAVNDWLSLGARGEVWWDPNHFFVAAFPGNRDFVNVERGQPTERTVIQPGVRTTYGALTIGANIKPQGLPAQVEGLTLRPELRYDRALNDVNAFDDLRSRDQWSAAIDLVMPVSF
ncbi:MAG: outer membrane beta-barrel protein [Bacteroidota bacterium]